MTTNLTEHAVDRAATAPTRLSDRDLGWLRYLHRKATTSDSWDREGHPHEHWDNTSTPPMLCWYRFDLIDSTYAVAMMADITPAWREVYGQILDELIFRHTGWWAAEDWLTQIGHDPKRAEYPSDSATWSLRRSAGLHSSSPLGLAGTSTACSRRAERGTTSSASSWVEASTTWAAAPS